MFKKIKDGSAPFGALDVSAVPLFTSSNHLNASARFLTTNWLSYVDNGVYIIASNLMFELNNTNYFNEDSLEVYGPIRETTDVPEVFVNFNNEIISLSQTPDQPIARWVGFSELYPLTKPLDLITPIHIKYADDNPILYIGKDEVARSKGVNVALRNHTHIGFDSVFDETTFTLNMGVQDSYTDQEVIFSVYSERRFVLKTPVRSNFTNHQVFPSNQWVRFHLVNGVIYAEVDRISPIEKFWTPLYMMVDPSTAFAQGYVLLNGTILNKDYFPSWTKSVAGGLSVEIDADTFQLKDFTNLYARPQLQDVGTVRAESLPNIKGMIPGGAHSIAPTGVFKNEGGYPNQNIYGQSGGGFTVRTNMDASRSHPTYQDGAKVMPDSLITYAYAFLGAYEGLPIEHITYYLLAPDQSWTGQTIDLPNAIGYNPRHMTSIKPTQSKSKTGSVPTAVVLENDRWIEREDWRGVEVYMADSSRIIRTLGDFPKEDESLTPFFSSLEVARPLAKYLRRSKIKVKKCIRR